MIFKRTFLFFAFFIPGSALLFSLPAQKILFSDDWAYEALGILSAEQGKVLFSDSSLTVEQFKKLVEEIDEQALSESGMLVYQRLNEYLDSGSWLSYESDALQVGFDPAFQGEFYYKTSEDTPWIWDNHYRQPLLLLPLNISLGQYISMEMDIYAGANEYAATLHDNYLNVPLDPVSQFDIHFPKRAFFSAGLPIGQASGVNFTMGQGEDFFGDTRMGSVVLSEYLERVIYGQFTLYSPVLKYTAEVMQYEVNKYHYMHYLQIRAHRTLSVSLSEGVMVNAPLELRFLNPFTVFHSYESFKTYTDYNEDLGHEKNDPADNTFDPTGGSRIGSYFGAKIEWQPLRYFRLYGLFAMDQLQLGVEKDNWEEDLTPDAMAFQGGAELTLPAQGGHWRFGIEGVYTYPYMYVLWDKHWSFYKENPEMDRMNLRYWTGSPFGPDSIAGTFWAGFHASAQWSAVLSFMVSAQGERSGLDIFDHDTIQTGDTYRPTHDVYTVTSSPTGVPVYTYTVSILGKWSPLGWLDLSLQPGYRYIANPAHQSGESAQGFEIAFSARIRPR